MEPNRLNTPSAIFHVLNSFASSLLWIPDDNVLQAFRLDLDFTLGPIDLVLLIGIHVNRIGELPDVNVLSVFKFTGGLGFCGGLSFIEVGLVRKRGDRHNIGRSPDVVVEKSLEL